MSSHFRDGSQTLFGRAPDLGLLLARVEHPGVTILLSRAQMGKTTLLLQLAYRLSASHLVGYTETSGQTTEPLRYAVQDLYTRWLAHSTYGEQAHAVLLQQKDRFAENLGTASGSFLTNLAKAAGKPLEAAAAVVKTALDGLVQANQSLRTGGQQLPQLQLEQARDLLQMVATITDRPLVIILDQWEKSIDLAAQFDLLELFLKHLDEWPPCHIVVGVRDEQPLRQTLEQRIGLGFLPRDAALVDLPFMHLDEGDEAARLLTHIRDKHALPRALPDDDLLNLIAGYPEVVNRWMRSDSIASLDELRLLANNAHKYLYPEFQEQLAELSPSELRLVMRLALLPGSGDPTVWSSLKPIFMEDVPLADCGKLHRRHLLHSPAPPSFGHVKRSEIALATLLTSFSPELADLCETLILRLAQQVRDTSPQSLPFVTSLVHLESFLAPLDLSPAAHLLCYAARSLFGEGTPIQPTLVRAACKMLGADAGSVSAILAMGLVNTLCDAPQEDDRERLLQELQQLATDYPKDEAIREQLAKGLFNTLCDAPQENDRERLLQELRQLATDYPKDEAVRERLAKGLFNTLCDAPQENDRERLLQELRQLAKDYPNDEAVRKQFAMGLNNTLNLAPQENDRERLLQELRQLAKDYPKDEAVREWLAKGLFNTLNLAPQENDRERLLQELRQLAKDYPKDEAVREWLAKGLFNTLNLAPQENDPQQRRVNLLQELRDLRQSYPDDAIWQQVAERIDLDEDQL